MSRKFISAVPEGFQLIACGPERAQDAIDMRDAILADIAQTNPGWYIIDETDDEFRDFFVSPECVALGIVASDGTLAGVGVASFRPAELERFRPYIAPEEFAKPRNVGYVELIQIALGFRGHGFQRLLFAELEAWLKENGATLSTSIVSPDNRYSLANFAKMGYRRVGEFTHKGTGYPRLNMIKRLDDQR